MELQIIKELLVRFLEAEELTDEEGRQLLAGLETLIEQKEQHLLVGLAYRPEEGKLLSMEDLQGVYWEVDLYYGEHADDHDHDHDDDDPGPDEHQFMHKWGWWIALLTGVLSATAYALIRKYNL